MKLIVGLGNPGNSYRSTRHNVGKSFVGFFAAQQKAGAFSKQKNLIASLVQMEWLGEKVTLAWPESYMNLSGESVRRLAEARTEKIERDLLVVVDDLALPFGKMRLRAEGSDGGHNGLKSIQAALGTKQFARLRFGIGHPGKETDNSDSPAVSDYVLSPFTQEEQRALESLFLLMIEGCRFWALGDFQKASNSLSDCIKKG